MLLITSQLNLKSNLILQNVPIYNKQLVTGTKNSTQVCKLQNGMSQQKPNNLKKKINFHTCTLHLSTGVSRGYSQYFTKL